jgi:carbonic anhydrase/acetyltransferase-like protein (isoleucine patch superfamily)
MVRPCPFTGATPEIDPSAYVDASAQVLGQVRIGARSSIWLNTVLRGDVNTIDIGAETNVQDLCCLHVYKDRFPLRLGDRVSVGHSVTLHGCSIDDYCLIGMGAVVMDGCEIGRECLVAAGSLVTPGTKTPPRSLVMGSPARVKRELNAQELEMVHGTWEHYVDYSRAYVAKFGRGF